MLFADGPGAFVHGLGGLAGRAFGAGFGELRGPGSRRWPFGEVEVLEAAVQDGGDRPGAGHRALGDRRNDRGGVVSGELGFADGMVEGGPGRVGAVPGVLVAAEPGLDGGVQVGGALGGGDLLVEVDQPGRVVGGVQRGVHFGGGGAVAGGAGEGLAEDGFRVGLVFASGLPGDDVQPVLGAAAGGGDIEGLPVHACGYQGVRGLGGAALGGVHGAGISEGGVLLGVGGGNGERLAPGAVRLAAADLDLTVAAESVDPADLEDVAVGEPLPVGGDHVVVEPGLDPVPGLGVVAVGEADPLRAGLPSVRLADLGEVLGGLPVEFGDVGLGLGDHQRVFPGVDVGGPVEHHVTDGLVLGGGEDTPLYLVVGDRFEVPVAEVEGSLLFPVGGEPVHLVQLQRAMPVSEQGEHAAGADRAELVFITHGDDAGAAAGSGVGQVQPVGGGDLAGLIQHDHVPRADLRPPSDSAVGLLAEEPGQVRRAHLSPGCGHFGGGDAGGVFRHGDHVHVPARGLGPRLGERAHKAGLAGARGGADHRHSRARGEQGGQRGGLPAAELPAGRGRGSGGFGALGVHELRAAVGGGGEDVLLGIQLGRGGIPVAARRGVDGLPVRSAGAQVVHVYAGGGGADEHDVDAVGLAGERGGG